MGQMTKKQEKIVQQAAWMLLELASEQDDEDLRALLNRASERLRGLLILLRNWDEPVDPP